VITVDSNVANVLLADKRAEEVALRLMEADFTYGDLRAASEEFARKLIAAGGAKGDRVLLLSGNSFHWVAAYLGILRAGMVCVPLPVAISAPELAYVLETTEARIAFVQCQVGAKWLLVLEAAGVRLLHESGASRGCYFAGVDEGDSACCKDFPKVATTDLAALMFTSGSTGKPRGVMVSHGNILANTRSIITALDLRQSDRVMVVLPFHYCFGTSLLHTYLKVGAMLVIDNRFTYPEVVLQRMQETECTSFAGVPSHYQILLRNSSLAKRKFPHLRTLLQAGGHLAPSFLLELQRILPNLRFFVMYGQTEATARLSCLPPELLSTKPGSIGKAIPGVVLRVLSQSGEEVAPGEVGEIVAEGENIGQGYWRAPAETAKTFRNGKLYTGDLATADEEGFLYVVDRTKEFVKCGGTRVSTRQIEDILLGWDELLEAAIVGVPDEVLGEAVRAFVVPRHCDQEGIEERLRLYCRANLPRSFHPRDIVVVKALPKNSAGKVMRAELKNVQIDAQTIRPEEARFVEA